MADKFLTEAHWKTTTKGKDLAGDADVLKALSLLARAEKGKPGAATIADQRDALGTIDKAMAAFEKANAKAIKADKALIALVADIGKATDRTRKDLEQQAKDIAAAQAKAQAEADADDGDDAPDILTTRMVPLLRQVRQGVAMHTKLAVAGREVVVMLSRKAIAPTRKALLVDMLEQKGSAKMVNGTCVLENKFITFVLDNPAAGMAKRISAALLKQTGMRVPVRVRGPNGDLDEDDEAQDTDAKPEDKTKPQTDETQRAKPLSDRLKTLLPQVQKALVDKHPNAAAIKLAASEAGALIKQARWDAAEQVLQALEKQLASPGSGPTGTPQPPEPSSSAPKGPKTGRFVNHIQARLAWVNVRKKLGSDLQSLERAILDYCKTQPDLSTSAAAKVRKLDGILGVLDERLTETLDKALGAPDDAQRLVWHEQARKVLQDYITFVKTDDLLDGIEKNPFVPLKTRTFLVTSLQTIDKSLP